MYAADKCKVKNGKLANEVQGWLGGSDVGPREPPARCNRKGSTIRSDRPIVSDDLLN